MANIASGSSHYFAAQRETTAGTLPSPFTPQKLRVGEGSDFDKGQSALTSNELTDTRMILSSTLGTPNPTVSFDVEYSANSFDLLIESAFQNTTLYNGFASTITVDVATDGTLTTDGGETWDTYNFNDADFVTVTGLTVSAEDGIYKISTDVTTDSIVLTDLSDGAVTLTAETDATLTLVAGRKATVLDTSTYNLTVSASGSTITSSTDIWTEDALDMRYGALVYLEGFSNSANNGYFKVDTVPSATVLTLDTSSLVDETISTGDVTVINNTSILTVSNEEQSFSLESGYTDVDQYRTMSGCQVGSMSIDLSTDAIASGSFDIMGTSITAFDVTPTSSSTVNASTTNVFNTYRGNMIVNGSYAFCLSTISISLDNATEGISCLFSRSLSDLVSGRSNASGSFVAYFSDASISNLFDAETAISLEIVMEDSDGNSMLFGLPECQLQSDTISYTETTSEQSVDFQALGNDTTYKNIYLIQSREIPS
jgi:hypothetical protein